MTWTVTTRKKDGNTETLEIDAESRKELFAELNRRGITAVRITEGKILTPKKSFKLKYIKAVLIFIVLALVGVLGAYYFFHQQKAIEKPVEEIKVKKTPPTPAKASPKVVEKKIEPTVKEDRNSLEWLKKHDKRYFVPTDAVRRANGRLYTKDGVRILESLPARTIHADKGQKKIFNHQAEKQIARLLHIEPGKFFIGNANYNERFIKSLQESIAEPTPISEDDDEQTRVLKEEVNAIKAELKARMDAGEDIVQIMKDSEKELRSLATFRNDIMKEVISARLDENVSEAEYQDYIKAANEMFKQRGLKEITCPAFAEGQLKYIREVHKAKQAAKQSTSKE